VPLLSSKFHEFKGGGFQDHFSAFLALTAARRFISLLRCSGVSFAQNALTALDAAAFF
jgi:hypothetical protein